MKRNGFVLVATLWMLTGITIAAAFFAQRISASITLAQQYDAHIQSHIACSDSQAEVAYLLASRAITSLGIGDLTAHIKLDNRPYRMEGDCIARLQDARGLYQINAADRASLGRLLSYKGVPESSHDRLLDTLADYIDNRPNIHRLNGVAKAEYKNAGLPDPTGQNLRSPRQLQLVYGWHELKNFWIGDEPFDELLTTSRLAAFNPNTAPPAVLMSLPRMSPEKLKKIVEYREIEPISDEGVLARMLGVQAEDLFLKIITFPSDVIRVSLGTAGQETSIRYNVMLTPRDADAPWRIDYYYHLPQRIIAKNNDYIPSHPFDLKAEPPAATSGFPIDIPKGK